jgi:DNA-binding winged helix-turn-helix (wHTH) protein
MAIAFSDFIFDSEARELRRAGERVRVSPRAFQLLGVLLEARPRALPRQELLDHLWPDSFAVEASLTNLVGELRAVLGETSRSPRFIRTVHGFGYAFSGEGDDAEPGGEAAGRLTCRLAWKGGRATLRPGAYVLGRELDADVVIDSTTVSRRHARLTVGAGGVQVEDLGSRNGTWVRDERIEAPAELGDEERFRVGSVRVALRLGRLDHDTATVDSGLDEE